MFQTLVPFMGVILNFMAKRREDIAAASGTAPETVTKVANAIEGYLSLDDRTQNALISQIEAARAHDIATLDKSEPLVNVARGLVRPCITYMAMAWYVYARLTDIPLLEEDYAIIGGILAFWFGFRPFEKRNAKIKKRY